MVSYTYLDPTGCLYNIEVLDDNHPDHVKATGRCQHCSSWFTNKWIHRGHLQAVQSGEANLWLGENI